MLSCINYFRIMFYYLIWFQIRKKYVLISYESRVVALKINLIWQTVWVFNMDILLRQNPICTQIWDGAIAIKWRAFFFSCYSFVPRIYRICPDDKIPNYQRLRAYWQLPPENNLYVSVSALVPQIYNLWSIVQTANIIICWIYECTYKLFIIMLIVTK